MQIENSPGETYRALKMQTITLIKVSYFTELIGHGQNDCVLTSSPANLIKRNTLDLVSAYKSMAAKGYCYLMFKYKMSL